MTEPLAGSPTGIPDAAGERRSPGPRTVVQGLAALAKSALLLAGVPATVVRLWLLSSPRGRPLSLQGVLGAHLALAAVGAGWLVAGSALVRDLVGALGHADLDPTSWSRRWALRLAALLLMVAAGAGAATTGRARPVAAGLHAAARPLPGAGRGAAGPASAPGGLVEAAAAAGLGALLGAALAQRARLLRRAAASLRRPGERQPRPSPRSQRLEALLGPLGETALLDWLDGANRLLWRSFRAAPPGTACPEVALVRAGPDGIELLMRRVAPHALEGFVALEGGAWWCLDPGLDLDELTRRGEGCGRLLPALLPVGEDGTASYLVNVAPGRRLAVSGEAERARRALSGIVLALRCLPWADELAVELLGVDPPRAAEQCYQLNASSPEELEALLATPPADPSGRVAERWCRQPLVVSATDSTGGLEALLARCAHHAGVVSLGGAGTEELVLDETGAWLEPLGLRLVPAIPTPAQLALADRLLLDAGASPRSAPPGGAPDPGGPPPQGPPVLAPPGRAEVRLLDGPPRLLGAATGAVTPRDLPRVVEAVAYLSLKGGAVSLAQLQDDLFRPQGGPGGAERAEHVLAAVRAALGFSSDGTALLGRGPGGLVTVHPEVTCDGSRLAAAARAACGADPGEAGEVLRAGLALVGPGPCCPLPAYGWLVAGGLREELLAAVVDAAHHLALLALAKGDTALARWAVERGRHAEPCSEALARDLMLACDAEGDHAGTARAWEDLEEGLARLGGNEPSEETRELYAALASDTR